MAKRKTQWRCPQEHIKSSVLGGLVNRPVSGYCRECGMSQQFTHEWVPEEQPLEHAWDIPEDIMDTPPNEAVTCVCRRCGMARIFFAYRWQAAVEYQTLNNPDSWDGETDGEYSEDIYCDKQETK